MKARKIHKGHRWFPSGGGCSCGPIHRLDAPRSERNGRLIKKGPGISEAREGDEIRGEKVKTWKEEMREMDCHYCGGPGGTIDHVIPQSKGGKTTIKNCVPACAPCNNYRKNLDYRWFKDIGWKTRPFA